MSGSHVPSVQRALASVAHPTIAPGMPGALDWWTNSRNAAGDVVTDNEPSRNSKLGEIIWVGRALPAGEPAPGVAAEAGPGRSQRRRQDHLVEAAHRAAG